MKCFRWFLVVGMVVFFVGSAARERELQESLKIMVVVSPVVRQCANGAVRRIDVVSIANSERYPVGGTLSVSFGGTKREFVLDESDVV